MASDIPTMDRAQILEALSIAYSGSQGGANINEATHFIERWQDSEEAWSFSDQMLHDPDAPLGHQFGCAKILRTKVRVAQRVKIPVFTIS